MTNRPDWFIYAYKTEPDVNDLKQVLENKELNMTDIEHRLMAIALKYHAMTHIPTTIEKTMTPEQLFNIQNPLWACGYTIQELYDWFKYRKPLDDYNRVGAIIKVSEQLNNTIKKQYSRERT